MKYLMLVVVILSTVGCNKDNPVYTVAVPVPGPAVITNVTPTNITCLVYDLANSNLNSLPDFDTLTPEGILYLPELNFYDTDNATVFQPFIGTQFASLETQFGLKCLSTLSVPETGNYQFMLTSDDGAELYIDGVSVINNDCLHAVDTATGSINLSQGNHNIKVVYYNNLGYKALELSWIMPNGVQSIVESQYFTK